MDAHARFSPMAYARRHPIRHDEPAISFFAGALLCNGGLGAVVTTPPDAVVIHFGHNNVWDIRVAERHKDAICTLQTVFGRISAIPTTYERLDQDAWYREYVELMQETYAQPYPRSFACGSLILGFDRRVVEVLGHELDVATGLCTVQFVLT